LFLDYIFVIFLFRYQQTINYFLTQTSLTNKMSKLTTLLTIVVILSLESLLLFASPPSKKPNIVLLLADDMVCINLHTLLVVI